MAATTPGVGLLRPLPMPPAPPAALAATAAARRSCMLPRPLSVLLRTLSVLLRTPPPITDFCDGAAATGAWAAEAAGTVVLVGGGGGGVWSSRRTLSSLLSRPARPFCRKFIAVSSSPALCVCARVCVRVL